MARSFSCAKEIPNQENSKEWPFNERNHCEEPVPENLVSFNGEVALYSCY